MTETPAIYTSLPEDLEPLNTRQRADGDACLVHLNRQAIGLSKATHEALGKPERVALLFGSRSRMLAIRPVREGGLKTTAAGPNGAVQVGSGSTIRRLGLPAPGKGQSHTFTPQLVEGALLIGPLPEAEA